MSDGAAVAFCILEGGFTIWSIRELTFTRVDALLYGAIAALLFRSPEMLPFRRYWVPAVTAIAAGALAVIAFRSGGYLPYESFLTAVAGYSACGIVFAVFVYICAAGDGVSARSVSRPPFCWFGRYSYAIYIFHPPLVVAYQSIIDPRLQLGSFTSGVVRFLVVTLISSALARLSWIVLESPFLKLKRHFEYATTGERHVEPATPRANEAMANRSTLRAST